MATTKAQESKATTKAQEIFAGSVGGICQVLVGQPFDTVKVRLQTQPREAPLYSGVADCTRKILKSEGIAGLYKGTLTPLLGAGVCVAIQFGALENCKRWMGKGELSLSQLYLAGAFSGLCNSVVSGPMEHVRTRLQVQSAGVKVYTGPGDFISKVYKEWGVRGLFKGQGITLLREFHGYGIYFMVYEALIQKTMKDRNIPRNQISAVKQLSFGALAGYTLWIMIYPIDVIKSKLQTDAFNPKQAKYSGSLDCARKVFQAEGTAGFYRGFGACMLRAGPANAVTFAAYEVVMNLLGR